MSNQHIQLLLISLLLTLMNTSYSPSLSHKFATLSSIAYYSSGQIQQWKCPECSQFKMSSIKTFENSQNQLKGFVGYESNLKTIVVSISSVGNISNWIGHMKTSKDSYKKCKNCEISSNLNDIFLKIQPEIAKQVQSLQKLIRLNKIVVIGHGVGGSLAILSALELGGILSSVSSIYTFGSQRIGNQDFADYLSKTYQECYRVINSNDVLPHLPFLNTGYIHGGNEIWYNEPPKYQPCKGQDQKCSNSLAFQELQIAANDIKKYINLDSSSNNLQSD